MATYLAAIGVHTVQWALSDPGAALTAWLPLFLSVAGLCTTLVLRRVKAAAAVTVLVVCGAAAMAMPGVRMLGVRMPGAQRAASCDVKGLLDGRLHSTERHVIEGEIVKASRSGGGSLRLRIRPNGPICGKILLTVKNPRHIWRAGTGVRFRSYLRRITNFGNPGEFDWAAWNARRGVQVSAYLWDDDDLENTGVAHGPGAVVAGIRSRIRDAAGRSEGSGSALVRALIVGDREGLDKETNEAFRHAGLAHVLAISGLHVGIVAATVVLSVRGLLLLLWPSFAAGHDVYRAAAVAAAVAVAAYGAISGGGVSVIRSVIMAEIALATLWYGRRGSGRRGSVSRALAWAAIVVAFVLPGVVREASFQLSFTAVAALIVYGECGSGPRTVKPGKRRIILAVFAASLVAWYATLPLAAQHFGRVSLAGPIVTPLVLPPLMLVLGLGFVGAVLTVLSLPGAAFLFQWAAVCAGYLLEFVRVVAAVPFCSFAVPAPGWGLVLAWLALPVVVFLERRQRRCVLVALGIVVLVLIVSGLHDRYRSDRLDVVFVSIGQGDSTLIRLPGGRVMLVDTGPPGRARLAVLPLLRRMWIGRIDTLVLTHVQSDHWGAAPELLGNVEIGEIWRPRGPCDHRDFLRFEREVRAVGIPIRQVDWRSKPLLGGEGAQRWSVRILGPIRHDGDCDDNDASIVLRVRFAGHGVLLLADTEIPAERRLLAEGFDLHADVLKVGHHGSRTSSMPAFVDAVAPRFALASVGAANRYGFPHQRVRALFESLAVRLYRTDLDGAVMVTLARQGIAVRTTKRR